MMTGLGIGITPPVRAFDLFSGWLRLWGVLFGFLQIPYFYEYIAS